MQKKLKKKLKSEIKIKRKGYGNYQDFCTGTTLRAILSGRTVSKVVKDFAKIFA
jgi:hypothetical protein